MKESERQRLLSDISNKMVSLTPQKVAEVKCLDGEYRNRPLIDIATAIEVIDSFRESN